MKDGASLGGITVRNPFGAKGLSPAALAASLAEDYSAAT